MHRYARELRPVHEAPLAILMPRLPTEDVIELPFDVSVIRLRTEKGESALYRRVHKKALLASAMDELSKPCPRADGYLYGRYARAELAERPPGAIRVATDALAGAGDVLASEWNIPCSLSPRQPTTLIFHDGAYQYVGPELPMETELLRRAKLTNVEIDEAMGRTVRAWYASITTQLARRTLDWLPGVSRFVHFFFNHLVCAIAWIAAVRGGAFENSRAVWFQIFVLVALRCVRDHLDLLYETLWPPSANRWLEWLLEHAFFRGVYKAFSVLRSFVGTRGVVSVVLGLGALLNAWVNGDEPGELASSLWSAMEPIVAAMVPEYGLVRIGLSMGRGWYDDQPFSYYHYMALGCAAASLVCSLADTGGASCRNLTFLPGIFETVGRFLVHFQTLRDFGGVLHPPSTHALEKVLEEACSWQWRAYSAQKAGVVLLYDGWYADAFFRELRVLRMLSATLVDELQQLKDKAGYTDDEAGRAMIALYTLNLNFPAVFASLARAGSDDFQKLHKTVDELLDANQGAFNAWYEGLDAARRGTLNSGSKRAPLDLYLVRLIRKTLLARAPLSDDDVAMAADDKKADAKQFQAMDKYQELLVDHLRARISAVAAMGEGKRGDTRALKKLSRSIAFFTHPDKKQTWGGVATEQLEGVRKARQDVLQKTQDAEQEIDQEVVEEARFSDEQKQLVHEFNAAVRARNARDDFGAIGADVEKLRDTGMAEEQLLGTLARLGKSIGIAEYKYDDLLRTHGTSWDDTHKPPEASQSPLDWFSISALFGALVRLVMTRIVGTGEGGGRRAEGGAPGGAATEEPGGATADAPKQPAGEAEPGAPEEAAPPTPGPVSAQYPRTVDMRGGRLKIVSAPHREDRGLGARREQVVRHIEEQKEARREEQKRARQRAFLARVVRKAKDVKVRRSEAELRLERQKNAELARENERLAAEAELAARKAAAANEKLAEQAFDVAMAEEAARSAVRELRVVIDQTAQHERSAATLSDQLAWAQLLSAEEKSGLQLELRAADGALAEYRQRLAKLEATLAAERARAMRDREHFEAHARELQARLGHADAHASHELASLEAKLGEALEHARVARAREQELSAELAGARASEEALVAEKVKLEKASTGRRAADLRSAIEAGDVALMKALRGALDADDPHVAKATRLVAAIESLEAAMQEGWFFSPDTKAIRTTLERHRLEGLVSDQVYDRFAAALGSMERHEALEKALSAADVDAVLAEGPVDDTSVQRAYHRILELERDKQTRSEAQVEQLRAAESTMAEEVRALREKLQRGGASEEALKRDLAAKTNALGAMRERLADLEKERLGHQDAHKQAATELRRLEQAQEGLEGIIAMQRRNVTSLERQLGAMRSDVEARLEVAMRNFREANSRARASDRLVATREDENNQLARRLKEVQKLLDENEARAADWARQLAAANAIRTEDAASALAEIARLRNELQASRSELRSAYTNALNYANRTSDPGVVAMVGLDRQKFVLPGKKPEAQIDSRLLNQQNGFLEVLQYLLREHRDKFVKDENGKEELIFRADWWRETDRELEYLGRFGRWAKMWTTSPSATLATMILKHGTTKVEDMLKRAIAQSR